MRNLILFWSHTHWLISSTLWRFLCFFFGLILFYCWNLGKYIRFFLMYFTNLQIAIFYTPLGWSVSYKLAYLEDFGYQFAMFIGIILIILISALQCRVRAKKMPPMGIEPMIPALRVRCLTTWPSRRNNGFSVSFPTHIVTSVISMPKWQVSLLKALPALRIHNGI